MIYYYSEQTSFFDKNDIITLNKSELLVKLVEFFKSVKIVALDVETTGLDPLTNKVVMLQLGFRHSQLVIDTRGFDFTILKKYLERKSITFIGHNIKFDYNMLKQYNIVLHKVYDTMLADMVIYNGRYSQNHIIRHKRYSLAGVYEHYFEKQLVKNIRKEFTTWGDTPFTYDQILYGAKDVKYPFEIKTIQAHWAKKYKLKKVISLENNASLAVGDIEYNGIHLDKQKWLDIYNKYSLRIIDTIRELEELLIEKEPRYRKAGTQLSLFDTGIIPELTNVNWNSDQQVYKILTKTFNIYPVDKDNKPGSGTPALILLRSPLSFIKKLIQYRKEAKIISSFGQNFLNKHLRKDKRIHTQFNQIVETGRMSSRNPNMQQIPSDAEFRKAFTAPDGKVIVSADYANQEGRVMADKAKDKDYIDFFNNGDGDAHSFVATKMFSAAFNKDFIVTSTNENKAYRQKGKTLNFMISFGGSAYTLAKTLDIPVKEADKLIDSFYKGFPTLKKLFQTNNQFAVKNGYIHTNDITNRIRWIPEWEEYMKLKTRVYNELTKPQRSKLASLKGRIGRKGQNTIIQGTAGDMTKTALILIRNKFLSLGIRPTLDASIKLVNVIHDEVLVEATENKQNIASNILKESMEKAGKYYVKNVVMTTIPDIGGHWKH